MTKQPFAQLPADHVLKATRALVEALDEWLVVKQVVTVENGRMAVKRLVEHDELQQRSAEFIEQDLLRPGGGSAQVLQRMDQYSRQNPGAGAVVGAGVGGGAGGDKATAPLIGQLQHMVRLWREQQEQQQSSSDEGNDDYQGSSDEEGF